MFEDGQYVKHKTAGFIGIIDGQTSIKDFFTGNKEVKFQYRIKENDTGKIFIAPQEDLEISDYKPPKTARIYDPNVKFQEKSFLREAGYHLELNAKTRRDILNAVIKEYNLYKVVSFLIKSTIYNRTGNKQRILRNIRSLKEWCSDVNWLMENYKENNDYASTLKLFEEYKPILSERGLSWKNEY